MSEDGIFSSRSFNMAGLEIDEKHRVVKDGQIFGGRDYIAKNMPCLQIDKIIKFTLVSQRVKNGTDPVVLFLDAQTEREARTEVNKKCEIYKDQKPPFIDFDKIREAKQNQRLQAGEVFN